MRNIDELRKIYPKGEFKEINAFGYFKIFANNYNELKVKKIYIKDEKIYALIRDSSDFYNASVIMLSCSEFQMTYKKVLYCSILKRRVGFGWLIVFAKHC